MPYPPLFSSTLTYANRYDLDQIDVFLEGESSNPMFFTVNGLPNQLSFGKHYFYLSVLNSAGQNYQLKTKYKKLFNQLDYILFLKAKNFSLLRRWRLKQEKKLWLKSKNKKNLKIMNKNEVKNFMDTYQRITQQMFKDMPKYSSIVMNLNNSHQIKNIKYS